MSFESLLTDTGALFRKGFDEEFGCSSRDNDGNEIFEWIEVPEMDSVPTRVQSKFVRTVRLPTGTVRLQSALVWWPPDIDGVAINVEEDDRFVLVDILDLSQTIDMLVDSVIQVRDSSGIHHLEATLIEEHV